MIPSLSPSRVRPAQDRKCRPPLPKAGNEPGLSPDEGRGNEVQDGYFAPAEEARSDTLLQSSFQAGDVRLAHHVFEKVKRMLPLGGKRDSVVTGRGEVRGLCCAGSSGERQDVLRTLPFTDSCQTSPVACFICIRAAVLYFLFLFLVLFLVLHTHWLFKQEVMHAYAG